MAIIGGLAWFQWGEAARERDNATNAEVCVMKEKRRADLELKKAQTTQSLFLADLAHQQRTAGDAVTGALLALEALPDDTAEIARPHVPEPELQLDGALGDLRERLVLRASARRSAPTASASSRRPKTRPRECGTPTPASQSASR